MGWIEKFRFGLETTIVQYSTQVRESDVCKYLCAEKTRERIIKIGAKTDRLTKSWKFLIGFMFRKLFERDKELGSVLIINIKLYRGCLFKRSDIDEPRSEVKRLLIVLDVRSDKWDLIGRVWVVCHSR